MKKYSSNQSIVMLTIERIKKWFPREKKRNKVNDSDGTKVGRAKPEKNVFFFL